MVFHICFLSSLLSYIVTLLGFNPSIWVLLLLSIVVFFLTIAPESCNTRFASVKDALHHTYCWSQWEFMKSAQPRHYPRFKHCSSGPSRSQVDQGSTHRDSPLNAQGSLKIRLKLLLTWVFNVGPTTPSFWCILDYDHNYYHDQQILDFKLSQGPRLTLT